MPANRAAAGPHKSGPRRVFVRGEPCDAGRIRLDYYPSGPFRIYAQFSADLYGTTLNPDSSVADALKDLGRPDEIGRVFAGFQKFLYQSPAA